MVLKVPSEVDFQFYSTVVWESALYNFNFLKFIEACFVAYRTVCLGECSIRCWIECDHMIGNQLQKEPNDNSDTTCQNLWNTAKAVLRGKFIALNAYIKKSEREQTDNLRSHLMELEK